MDNAHKEQFNKMLDVLTRIANKPGNCEEIKEEAIFPSSKKKCLTIF